jgi:hypothetical protein
MIKLWRRGHMGGGVGDGHASFYIIHPSARTDFGVQRVNARVVCMFRMPEGGQHRSVELRRFPRGSMHAYTHARFKPTRPTVARHRCVTNDAHALCGCGCVIRVASDSSRQLFASVPDLLLRRLQLAAGFGKIGSQLPLHPIPRSSIAIFALDGVVVQQTSKARGGRIGPTA